MEIYSLRINGFDRPMGCDISPVICSWKIRDNQGKNQTDAKILVALDPEMEQVICRKEGKDLCGAGEVLDLDLKPYTRYYYQITVTSDAAEVAESEISWFETGLMEEPWQAQWIGIDQPDPYHPEFVKRFVNKPEVESARLYICGLGVFEAYLNEQKVGDDLLAPFINDYRECFQYCTYDVTSLLAENNTLSVLLGNGWYKGRYGITPNQNAEKTFALIAQLRIVYQDGSIEQIVTDTSWQYRASFLELTDIYDGETQNYLLWEEKDNPWHCAILNPVDMPLVSRYSLPVHEMESLPVKEIIHTPAGETVLDFGQNFAGYVECTQVLPKGTTMVLEFAEILQNGNFYHDNYRSAKSVFTYISDGQARTIRPFFTFFGFRYVRITGVENLEPACFTGRPVYSQLDRCGYIRTGHEKINQLCSNSLWGLKSNFLDMPTDCPQRDERLGWTGDAQVFAPTACYFIDGRAFYAKYLRDLHSDQKRNDGQVAMFLPNGDGRFSNVYSTVWSDAATFIPKTLYTYYGSKEMLRKHYPMMKAWVDFVYRKDVARGQQNLFNFGFHYSDWLALDGPTEQYVLGRTDPFFIASVYYYVSTQNVADAAELLGLEDAQEYKLRAQQIKQAVMDEYVTNAGHLAVDTQTAHLVALKFGIYRDREVMAKGLRRRMLADCRRLRGGFVGSTMMNTVLAENGMEQMAYDLLFFEGFPGWLYAVNMGATTIWERWNSVLPDGSISGTGMNSLNHYSYGSVMEFMFRCSAGICPVEPAFRKVRIKPLPERRLGFVECSFDSAFGKYVSNWEICQDGKLKFHIEIPFRCTAEVCLPEREPMLLDAGSYDFTIETQRDYRALYTPDTPLGELVKDPRAVEIIERNIPKLLNNIHTIVEPGTTLVDILDESVPMNMVYRSCSLIQAWKEIETDRIKDIPMYEKTIEEICALR